MLQEETKFLQKKEKPSNTEVLGLLLDEDKIKFITKLEGVNIETLCKASYLIKRLEDPTKSPIRIHNEVIEEYLSYKCSLVTKQGNRSDQIVDALKHIVEKEEENKAQSLIGDINK